MSFFVEAGDREVINISSKNDAYHIIVLPPAADNECGGRRWRNSTKPTSRAHKMAHMQGGRAAELYYS